MADSKATPARLELKGHEHGQYICSFMTFWMVVLEEKCRLGHHYTLRTKVSSLKFRIYMHTYIHAHVTFIPVNLHHANLLIEKPGDRLPVKQKLVSVRTFLYYKPSKISHQWIGETLKWLETSRDSPAG